MSPKIVDYKTCRSHDVSDLDKQVVDYLKKGYEPWFAQGTVDTIKGTYVIYSQVVVKYEA